MTDFHIIDPSGDLVISVETFIAAVAYVNEHKSETLDEDWRIVDDVELAGLVLA